MERGRGEVESVRGGGEGEGRWRGRGGEEGEGRRRG